MRAAQRHEPLEQGGLPGQGAGQGALVPVDFRRGQPLLDGGEVLLHAPQLLRGGESLLPDGVAPVKGRLLGQVADGQVANAEDGAAVRREQAGQKAQERTLPEPLAPTRPTTQLSCTSQDKSSMTGALA